MSNTLLLFEKIFGFFADEDCVTFLGKQNCMKSEHNSLILDDNYDEVVYEASVHLEWVSKNARIIFSKCLHT